MSGLWKTLLGGRGLQEQNLFSLESNSFSLVKIKKRTCLQVVSKSANMGCGILAQRKKE